MCDPKIDEKLDHIESLLVSSSAVRLTEAVRQLDAELLAAVADVHDLLEHNEQLKAQVEALTLKLGAVAYELECSRANARETELKLLSKG